MLLSYAQILSVELALSSIDSGHEVLDEKNKAVRKVPYQLGVARIKFVRNLRQVRRAKLDFSTARDSLIREITGVAEGPAQLDPKNDKHKTAWNDGISKLLKTEVEIPVEALSLPDFSLDVNPIPYEGVLEALVEAKVASLDP